MAYQFFLARHPNRPRSRRHLIIEDFLEIARASKVICLRKMIEMTQDLLEHGLKSRYVKPLGGPLYELKDRTADGGARVYFLRYGTNGFILGRAECKKEDAADETLLSSLLDVIQAIENQPSLLD